MDKTKNDTIPPENIINQGINYLLGLYAVSHFFFYPLLLLSCIFYNWQYALLIFASKVPDTAADLLEMPEKT